MSSTGAKVTVYLHWLCLIAILFINAQHGQSLERLCGNQIPKALDLICINGYNPKPKKSIDPNELYADDDADVLPSLLQDLPFFSRVPTNFLAKTRRRRHGIYDECCKKPCTRLELQSYCQ